MDLQTLLPQFMSLAGFAGLVAVLINAGKQFGIVKDGQAPTYSLLANLAGFAVLVLVRVFAPQVDPLQADTSIASIAQILVLALGLFAQLGSAKLVNNGVKGLPLIGYSHSRELEKAQTVNNQTNFPKP